jgi:hypothetical protein
MTCSSLSSQLEPQETGVLPYFSSSK